jgi:hypothetical protein
VQNEIIALKASSASFCAKGPYSSCPSDGDAGWVGLHRFFGMYVVNHTMYGGCRLYLLASVERILEKAVF